MMNKIHFIDTSLRDGNQSLWDATGLKTQMFLDLAPIVDRIGFKAVDFVSNSNMETSVRYHRENPWEKVRLVTKAMPNTPLSFGTTTRRFIGFKRTPYSIIGLVIERMAANGIRRIWILDAAHEIDTFYEVARLSKAAGIEEVVVALSYSISPAHTDEYYAEKTKQITACPDVDTVYLKDQGGLLTLDSIKTLIPAIQANLNGKGFEIHSHCNTGLAPLVYLEAVRMGVAIAHTGVPPLANGSAQPSIHNIIKNIEFMGYSVDIDQDALKEMSDYLFAVAEKTGRQAGAPPEYDISYYDHQLPGGMTSTLRRQLAERKMEDRLPEVIEEIKKVRKELGYPIMVTPLSQIVGSQATMNIITGERYKIVPNGVMEYVAGFFGPPPVPIEPNIFDKIAGMPKTKKLMAAEFPQPATKEIRQQMDIGPDVSDEEFLLRYAIAADDVDAMLAAGPIQASG